MGKSMKGRRPGLTLLSFLQYWGLNASYMLGKHFTTELQSQALWPILKSKIKLVLLRALVNFQVPPSSEFSRKMQRRGQVCNQFFPCESWELGWLTMNASSCPVFSSFPNGSHPFMSVLCGTEETTLAPSLSHVARRRSI